MLKRLLLVVLATKALLAQSVPLSGDQAAPPSGSLSGVVREAGTGKLIQGATVILAGPKRLKTVTDAEGAYSFRDLPPGHYKVSATIRVPAFGTAFAELSPSQNLTSIDVFVRGFGEISGRVLDEDGEPVPEADVFLVGREYQFGKLRYSFRYPTRTDDRGAYRLDRLLAGVPYLVLAKKQRMVLPAISDAPQDPKLRRRVHAPTYYPNSLFADGAELLVLRAGEVREGVDVRMARLPSYCIEGVLAIEGRPAQLRFEVLSEEPSRGIFSGGGVYTAEPMGISGGDGRIRVCDLPPGLYRMTARSPYNTDFYGTALVAITDADARNVIVPAVSRIALRGEVVWQAAPSDEFRPPRLTITLDPIQRARFSEEGLVTTSTPSNEFLFPSLMVDDYAIHVDGLADNLYIQDIRYGSDSVLHKPLRPGSAIGNQPLRIIVGCDPGFFVATVADRSGHPLHNIHVVLMPSNVTSQGDLAARIIVGQTDQNGTYRSGPIAPGRYYLVSSRVAPDTSPERINQLWRSRSNATDVEITAGRTQELTLGPPAVE